MLGAAPPIGVMIEVPAAVYLAGPFAEEVDFLSVGSNDLTQYLLAVDRGNARVADLYQALHPAVLAALEHIIEAAHQRDKPVSICGELAGDPRAAFVGSNGFRPTLYECGKSVSDKASSERLHA